MESFGAASQRGKVTTSVMPPKRTRRPVKVQDTSQGPGHGNASSRPSIGIINVIFVAPGRTGSQPFRVMSVARLPAEDINSGPKRAKIEIRLVLSFLNEDKVGTIQAHDDALVIILKIGGYDVKIVLLDQGSSAKIMYLDLYRGLNLTTEDLIAYNSLLVSFEGKVVIHKG